MSKKPETLIRVETLSDAIFAFAMTLLILSIKVPSINPRLAQDLLASALIKLWPEFVAYIISFIVITIFWLNHSNSFNHIERVDPTLMIFNTLFLITVVIIPFSTNLAGDYENVQTAVFFYEANIFLAGLFAAWAWWYATAKHRLVAHDLDVKHIKVTRRAIAVIPLISLVAMGLSFLSPLGSLLTYLLTPIPMVLSGR